MNPNPSSSLNGWAPAIALPTSAINGTPQTSTEGIQWAQGEAVTVNTRALIDKVLARYSAEHTVLREMFQNAADAEANIVELRFESSATYSGGIEITRAATPLSTISVANERTRDRPSGENLHTSGKGDKKDNKRGIFSRLKISSAKNVNPDLKNSRLTASISSGHRTVSKDSSPSRGSGITSNLYTRIIVRNNGHSFRPQDWSRLKRIAEGNPDENKIGAFGVGFYSVFSECDEPVVYSGDKAMSFYWVGNQLFTREAEGLPFSIWTTFVLPYRTPTTLPDLGTLARFVANSLTFVGLEGIEVFVDDMKIIGVRKELGKSRGEDIPLGLRNAANTLHNKNMLKHLIKMDVEKVEVTELKMSAMYEPFVLGEAGSGERREDKVNVHVWTAYIETQVEPKTAEDLTRATLKPPPKKTKLSLVAAHSGTAVAGISKGGIFSYILPGTLGEDVLKSQNASNNPGRIFISFQTHQTTGMQAHLSTHSVIPTVERENIDFSSRQVKTWNSEMMRVAGLLSRIMYHHDILLLKTLKGPEAICSMKEIMQRYAFKDSTPTPIVGHLIKTMFFELTTEAGSGSGKAVKCVLEILSTNGVMDASLVRLPFASDIMEQGIELAGGKEKPIIHDPTLFFKKTPLLPRELAFASPKFINNLKDRGILKQISVEEISADFSGRILSLDTGKEVLAWLVQKKEKCDISDTNLRKILSSISISIPAEFARPQRTLKLSNVKTFINPSGFLPKSRSASAAGSEAGTLPLPLTCVPLALTVDMNPVDLKNKFKWTELEALEWTKYISSGTFFTSAYEKEHPGFAKDFLLNLSNAWASLHLSKRSEIQTLLQYRTFMPTKGHGLLVPSKVHFASVKWAGNAIPIVDNDHEELGEAFLLALGLRKSVELKIVLENLMKDATSTGTCHQYDVVNYLLSINQEIPKDDMDFLKASAFCAAEGDSKRLYKPSELFEPDERLRMLGLPILKWPMPWKTTPFASKRILEDLGLQIHPKLTRLAVIAADKTKNHSVRDAALKYLVEQLTIPTSSGTKTEDPNALADIPFLPVEQPNRSSLLAQEGNLFTPKQVYSNPGCAVLQFLVLRSDLQPHAQKLLVREHPPADKLVDSLLQNPPKTPERARGIFQYLATQIAELESRHYARLGKSNIVPIQTFSRSDGRHESLHLQHDSRHISLPRFRSGGTYSNTFKHIQPCQVFVLASDRDSAGHAELFDCVDFGAQANVFLLKCGAGSRPSDLDVAKLMVVDPHRVLGVIGVTEYRARLRALAFNPHALRTGGFGEWISEAPFLLAFRIVKRPRGRKSMLNKHGLLAEDLSDDEDEEEEIQQAFLAKASQIMIVDDYSSYRFFKEHILAAPFEEDLEDFYHSLGSPLLSESVKTEFNIAENTNNESAYREAAEDLRKLIVERTPLFFHDHKNGAKFDIKSWLAALQVKMVEDISIVRSIESVDPATQKLRMLKFSMAMTAAIPEGAKVEEPVLYINNGYKNFDVSHALIHTLMKTPKPSQAYLLDCLLREDLSVLEERGYNVKRIIKAREADQTFEFKSSKDSSTSTTNGVTAVTTSITTVALDSTLQKAISSSKQFNGTILESTSRSMEVVDKGSYCDSTTGQSLVYHTSSSNGIRIFLPQKDTITQRQESYKKHLNSFQAFAGLLKTLAGVFGLNLSVIHLFHDSNSSAMAFNKGGSLFFNLKYFNERHQTEVVKNKNVANALRCWFMVMCHELAHNLVLNHSAGHSYHLEELAAKFMPNLNQVIPGGGSASGGKITTYVKGKGNVGSSNEGQTPIANGGLNGAGGLGKTRFGLFKSGKK